MPFIQASQEGIISSEGALWEPGAAFNTIAFRVVNKGSLAIKYKILLNIPDNSSQLIEVIDWNIQIGTDQIPVILGSGLKEDETDITGYLLPEEFSEPITVQARMSETSGNTYQNLSLENISCTIFAAQDTVEFDSYRNTYDKFADFGEFTGGDLTSNTINPNESSSPEKVEGPSPPEYAFDSDQRLLKWDPQQEQYFHKGTDIVGIPDPEIYVAFDFRGNPIAALTSEPYDEVITIEGVIFIAEEPDTHEIYWVHWDMTDHRFVKFYPSRA